MPCSEYVKEAMADITDDSEFKNAIVHCLEFMAQTLDEQRKVSLDMLRSAFQIAQRKGVDTNWEAFEAEVHKAIKKLAE